MNARSALSLARPHGRRHPARLGKYQLTGVLGEGAMGTVYQGLDPLLQRPVAVKAIRPQLLQGEASELSLPSLNERFRIEAQAAGRLSHPGIVPVYEYGEEDGIAYIAMEYVKGCTLTRYLSGAELLAEDDVLSVAVQVLEALHHAHELGVWHRDIKPGNLIVTADGCVKVTDFGIARLEAAAGMSREHTLLLVGSPGYIAPERYTGEPPDRRVDIFSCGVLLYQLLTGVPPFTGNVSEVMYQVLHRDPVPPSRAGRSRGGDTSYDAVVAKALARRPADRYATALELRDALLSVARRPVSRRLKAATPSDAVTFQAAAEIDTHSTRTSTLLEFPTQRLARPASNDEPAIAPAPEPAPQPVWPAATLRVVEASLADLLGPIALLLVKRAAARCHDLPTLLCSVAAQGLTAREQQTFFAAVRRQLVGQPAAQRSRPSPQAPAPQAPPPPAQPRRPSAPLPVLDDAATLVVLQPQTVARAEALLMAHAGPIASVFVRRALAVSGDRMGFFVALAEEARACVDRHRLLRALQQLD